MSIELNKPHKAADDIPPWIHCPCCFYPIEITLGKEVGTHDCTNTHCSLGHRKVRVHVSDSFERAKEIKGKAEAVVLIGEIKRFYDVSERPTNYWGYFFLDADRVERFRLLKDRPLERLMPASFSAEWAAETAARINRPISVYSVEYDENSGDVVRDPDDGFPVLHVSYPVRSFETYKFCRACVVVRDAVLDKMNSQPDFKDPCGECGRRQASAVFAQMSNRQNDMLLAASNPSRQDELIFEKLHGLCWLGLVEMAFPVIVGDVIIAILLTGQVLAADYKLDENREEERKQKLEALGLRGNEALEKELNREGKDLESRDYLRDVWQSLRAAAHQLQMTATGQYGQINTVRNTLLRDSLLALARDEQDSPHTRWALLKDVGGKGLELLARFFSFQKSAILVNDAGMWQVAACWPPTSTPLPMNTDESLAEEALDPPNPRATVAILKQIWPGVKDDCHPCWVAANSKCWYVFTERTYPNGKPEGALDVILRHLIAEATRTFHRGMQRRLNIFALMENILSIAHNLNRPMAAIGSSLATFDAILYQEHLHDFARMCYNSPYIEKAITELLDALDAARRRAKYEIDKIEFGVKGEGGFYLRRNTRIRVSQPKWDSDNAARIAHPEGLLEMVLWSFQMYAAETRNRSITVLYPHSIPKKIKIASIEANSKLLQLAIDNIVDNAVKYSFDNTEIRIRLDEETKDGKEYVVLSVSNFGNGVMPGEKDKIWNRFYRGIHSTTNTLEVAGTGLGTYLIKTIVELYGGYVGFESDFGGGVNVARGEGFKTTVWAALPLVH